MHKYTLDHWLSHTCDRHFTYTLYIVCTYSLKTQIVLKPSIVELSNSIGLNIC